MSARTYTIGVPVCITVGDDGSVEFSVDLSEADALFEDEQAGEDYSPFAVIADQSRVAGAAQTLNNYLTRAVTP